MRKGIIMDGMGHDLIGRIVDPPRSGDFSKKNGLPSRVQFNKDKGHHQGDQHKRRQKQKQFNADDPHVDLTA